MSVGLFVWAQLKIRILNKRRNEINMPKKYLFLDHLNIVTSYERDEKFTKAIDIPEIEGGFDRMYYNKDAVNKINKLAETFETYWVSDWGYDTQNRIAPLTGLEQFTTLMPEKILDHKNFEYFDKTAANYWKVQVIRAVVEDKDAEVVWLDNGITKANIKALKAEFPNLKFSRSA